MESFSSRKIIFLVLISLFLFSTPYITNGLTIAPPTSYTTFEELIDAIVNFLFWVGVGLAPLMILIGAFFLVTAAGDPSKVQRGKTIILYTAIGFIVVLLAKGLISMVRNIIGA